MTFSYCISLHYSDITKCQIRFDFLLGKSYQISHTEPNITVLCIYFGAWPLNRFLSAQSGDTQPDSTRGQQQQLWHSISAGGAAASLKTSCHTTWHLRQTHCSSQDDQEAGAGIS